MTEIRKLPAQAQRVETGPLQFGEDWPGVFIRGDNAFWLCGCIDAILAALEHPGDGVADSLAMAGLKGLRSTLASSDLTGISKREAGEGGPGHD